MSRGLYIHIPFCKQKCRYCNFYSGNFDLQKPYIQSVVNELSKYENEEFSTLYIGGGTPSILSIENFKVLLDSVSKYAPFDEATVEVNPADNLAELFRLLKEYGINRISMGVQSANEDELKFLGRRHTSSDVIKCVNDAKSAGFSNISVDIMIGLPYSSIDSLNNTIDFITSLDITHISSYILKVEEGTPLYNDSIDLLSDEEVADQYLHCVKRLEDLGFSQYEISNFSKKGYEAIHNTNYWKCREYVGLGPSAHGFYNGERYHYESDIYAFINNPVKVSDSDGGDIYEQIFLGLRLRQGININLLYEYSNSKELLLKVIDNLVNQGYCNVVNNTISLTSKGFLVSNSIILKLTEC